MHSYWRDSRAPRYSLLLALPLFVAYHTLETFVPPGPGSGLRNGADVILQMLFIRIAGVYGPLLLVLCIVGAGTWLVFRDLWRHDRDLRLTMLPVMIAESTALALGFGVAVSVIASQLVRPTALIGPTQLTQLSLGSRVMLSVGAGLYEELLFRVLLVGSLAYAGQRLLGWRPVVAAVWAAFVGAVVFAAFHYIGPYGDRLQMYSFVFRTIAGLAFSALYLLRGFGITAWTHALYDVFLLLR